MARKHLDSIPETHFLRILFPQLFHPEIGEEAYDTHEDGHNPALEDYISRDILRPDAEDAFYVYRQTKKGRTFTGIIGLASIESYKQGLIKKHELTQVKKESQIADYFRHIRLNGSPVLLTYPDSPEINEAIGSLTLGGPGLSMSTEDHVKHEIWRINDTEEIGKYKEALEKVPAFYIADGHHRCASYAHLSDELEGFMAYLLPSSQLEIRAFHRLIRHSNIGLDALIVALQHHFAVEEIRRGTAPEEEGHIYLATPGAWYCLQIPAKLRITEDLKDRLDVSILEREIIMGILGIEDSRTSPDIMYVSDSGNLLRVSALLDSGEVQYAFLLHPLSIEEVIEISDAGDVLPPKSTWIEPKMRSGMLIHQF